MKTLRIVAAALAGVAIVGGGLATLDPLPDGWAAEAAGPNSATSVLDRYERSSHDGLFRVAVTTGGDDAPLGRPQAWVLRVRTASGAPVPGATVRAEGWMPETGETMRSRPRASSLGDGTYRLEDLVFDRPGWWNVKLRIDSPMGIDSLAFNLTARAPAGESGRWSAAEVETLRSLWLGTLEPLPPDPSNRYGDDPRAAALGHRLFFDTRLSSNGQVSCGSCHRPERQFQDDLPLGRGVGTTPRRTMPVAGTAYSPWQFWDGRKDSQWSQALGPLESPVEHGGTRAQYAHVVAAHYRAEYEALFGPLPDLADVPTVAGPVDDPAARAAWEAMSAEQREAVTRVYVNIGKAIAAYERRLLPGPGRFDEYVERLLEHGRASDDVLTADEVAGLRLFIGKANCTNCHNGPLLTDNHFHNTGVPAVAGLPVDAGRALGAGQVLDDEFNCRSRWSDARPEECAELEFLVPEGEELVRAYKTPSLRNVAERPPYMHAGQIAGLAEVLEHYNRAPESPSGRTELERLRLSREELRQLEAYLRTLSGPLAAPEDLLRPPALNN